MMFSFVAGQPALRIGKTVVVADLHLGVECEIGLEDVVLDLMQKSIGRVAEVARSCRAKRIVLLGDVKHRLPTELGELEWRMDKKIPPLIGGLARETGCKVDVISGNHDGGLAVKMADGLMINGVGLVHGHKWPSEGLMKCRTIVVAHTHPTIAFRDTLGHRTLRKAWLISSFTEKIRERYPRAGKGALVIVMPAFSDFITGSAANEGELLGPLLGDDMFKRERAQCYLLDGTQIGEVKDLKV